MTLGLRPPLERGIWLARALLVRAINACARTEGDSLSDADGMCAGRHMAAGQSKGQAQRTYGVTNGAADRPSPDSSGSPQQCAELPLVQDFD